MVSSRWMSRRWQAWRTGAVYTVLLLLFGNARPVAAGPYRLGPPGAVITPADGDAPLAYDGLARTAWVGSDYAEGSCGDQPHYADPVAQLTVALPRPLLIDWFGALSEASARAEGISDAGREGRTRLFGLVVGSEEPQLLAEWRFQDNGKYGTHSLDREWRMAGNLPDAPVKSVSVEVAATAFSNCDNDVTGQAWASVALYDVLFRGHDAFPGDVNLDGRVDLNDFGLLKENFGQAYYPADFDQSGGVELTDFGLLKANFGKVYLPAAVSEPATWLLAALGSLLFGLSRRRSTR